MPKTSPPNPTIRLTKKDKSFRDVVLILFRNKKPAVATFILLLIAALGYVSTSVPVFKSESKILIRLGRENVSMDPSVAGPTVSLYQLRESEVNSEISILTSRGIIEQVVDQAGPKWIIDADRNDASQPSSPFIGAIKSGAKTVLHRLGLRRDIPERDRAVAHVRNGFSVAAEKQSNIIQLTYRDTSPEKSRLILDRLLQTFLDHHIEVHKTQASPTFFQEQANRLEQTLATREQELKSFRARYGITSVEHQKGSLQQQIESMQAERDKAAGMVDSSRARIASLKKELSGKSRIIEVSRVTGRQNPVIEGIKSKLMDLRMQEMDLAARYPDNHRPLQEIREQITASEAYLSRELAGANVEVTTGIDQTYQALQIELASAQSERDSHLALQQNLDRELSDRRNKLKVLLTHELEEKELEREITLLQQEYIQYRDNLQRAVRAAEMDRSKVANVSIVQKPTFGTTPVNPRKGLEVLLSLIIALVGAALSALVFESMSHSLRDGADVEKNIGVEVLATIPNQKG
jgi:uncharacterized protein involved in exopolysaccharide biosynthesis